MMFQDPLWCATRLYPGSLAFMIYVYLYLGRSLLPYFTGVLSDAQGLANGRIDKNQNELVCPIRCFAKNILIFDYF